MREFKRVLGTAPLVLLLVLALSTWHCVPANAQAGTPVVAVDPVVGPPGTVVSYLGVGFTPAGRVSLLLAGGLGSVMGELAAGPTGVVTGQFDMPDPWPKRASAKWTCSPQTRPPAAEPWLAHS